MSTFSSSVSLHPYFKVKAGQLPAVKALLPLFVAKTQGESANLAYGFTLNGDEVFCRESYLNAEGVLAHLANVGPELDKMLGLAALIRLEIHGPAGELAKLKAPLAGMNPAWFECECGVTR